MSRGTNWPALRAAMTLAGVLIATPALGVLTHRYSFTADGSDSVGSLNWTANGGATFSGGQVTLDGVDDFLSLGATPLPTTAGSSATIEVWGTYSPTTAPGSRIFDFTDTNLPGSTYLYLTPAATPSTPTPATVSSNTRLRFNDGIAENGPTAPGTATGPQVLLTAVIDVTNGLYSLYRDGGLIATAPTAGSDVLGTLGLTSNSHRLGAGQSAPVGGDLPQFLSGSISEFRVYDHVPTAREVLNNAIAGPNALPPTLAAKTWVPAGSGDWNAGGNWSAAGAPAASHRGVIASGGAAVVAGSPDPVGAVQIDNGTLTIGAGATLQSLYPLDLAPGDANTATVNVNAGGRLVTSGILNDGLTGAKTLNVDGGVIEAGFANSIVQVGTTTNVGALGMTLAMGAGGMTWDSALVGAGTIRKTGAGVLNIRGGTTATNNARVDQNPLFTGEFHIEGGTVNIGQHTGVFGRGGSAGWGKVRMTNSTLLHNTQAPGNGSVLGADLEIIGDNVVDNLSPVVRQLGYDGSLSGSGTLRFRKSGILTPEGLDFQNSTADPDVTNAGFTGRIVIEGNISVRIRHEASDFPNAILELANEGVIVAKRGPDPNAVIQLGGIAGVAGSRLEASIAGGNAPTNPPVTYELGFGGANVDFAGTIQDNNVFDFVSVTKVGANTQTLSGPNTYSGPTTINGGKLLVNGTHQQNATLLLPMNNYTVNAGGTLGGSGVIGSVADTIDVSVAGGVLAPGANLGTLTVEGNVTFAAGSRFEIDALGANTDRLIANVLDISGATLDVGVLGSTTAGARVIAEYDSLVGNFAALDLPAGFTVSLATPGQIILNVPTFVVHPGDFDKNGFVNAADLAKWRLDVGVNGNSDADNDGDSDASDFVLWQRFLGSGPGVTAAGAAVPEPASALLAAMALLAIRRRAPQNA